jgi:hypothetical protein
VEVAVCRFETETVRKRIRLPSGDQSWTVARVERPRRELTEAGAVDARTMKRALTVRRIRRRVVLHGEKPAACVRRPRRVRDVDGVRLLSLGHVRELAGRVPFASITKISARSTRPSSRTARYHR